MNAEPVRYLGVDVVAEGREYRFRVDGKPPGAAERIFRLWIAAACFRPGKLTFQDGPEIASRKLRTMLQAEQQTQPLELRQDLSESDITDYAVSGKVRHKAWTEEQRNAARLRTRQNRQSTSRARHPGKPERRRHICFPSPTILTDPSLATGFASQVPPSTLCLLFVIGHLL